MGFYGNASYNPDKYSRKNLWDTLSNTEKKKISQEVNEGTIHRDAIKSLRGKEYYFKGHTYEGTLFFFTGMVPPSVDGVGWGVVGGLA